MKRQAQQRKGHPKDRKARRLINLSHKQLTPEYEAFLIEEAQRVYETHLAYGYTGRTR